MSIKNDVSIVLLACACCARVYGQGGLLGSAGTYSSDGWKFSASYFAEPPLAPGQRLSIAGQTDVMHTDAKAGRPVIFHRFFTDPESKTYWGYDVEVEPLARIGFAKLRFKPFSLRAPALPKEYHASEFTALAAPEFPTDTFLSGQTIAVDVLKNPTTGQKVVDYIEIEFEPIHMPSKAEPRDFQVADVVLHILVPSLRTDDADVPPGVVAAQSIVRKLVWFSVPGRGRFLVSLTPYAGYAFQKAGVVNGNRLWFDWNGSRYDVRSRQMITESSGAWNLYVLAAPAATVRRRDAFTFGGVNSVDEFASMTE